MLPKKRERDELWVNFGHYRNVNGFVGKINFWVKVNQRWTQTSLPE